MIVIVITNDPASILFLLKKSWIINAGESNKNHSHDQAKQRFDLKFNLDILAKYGSGGDFVF